ncbi:hypothetical protein ABFS83_10G075000 [Erythranthe nasuta]
MEGDSAGGAGKEAAVEETAAMLPAVEKAMHVLVAIDDSEESFNALQWVLDKILKPKSAAETAAAAGEQESKLITIVHVVEPLPRYAFPGGYVVESSTKAQEQNAARILSRAFDMCRDTSVKAKTLILEGDPKDRICRAVEEMNVNLLVIGSRGLGQIKRWLSTN